MQRAGLIPEQRSEVDKPALRRGEKIRQLWRFITFSLQNVRKVVTNPNHTFPLVQSDVQRRRASLSDTSHSSSFGSGHVGQVNDQLGRQAPYKSDDLHSSVNTGVTLVHRHVTVITAVFVFVHRTDRMRVCGFIPGQKQRRAAVKLHAVPC